MYNKTSQVRINVTLNRVILPLLPWKAVSYYIFWVCVCSFSYPACKAHAPYYTGTCSPSGSNTFLHLSNKWNNFRGNHWTQNVCFNFLYNFCLKNLSFSEEFSEIHSFSSLSNDGSKASSFSWQYTLPSLRSSSNFLRLLPLLVISISSFIFPSITCRIRQLLREMLS